MIAVLCRRLLCCVSAGLLSAMMAGCGAGSVASGSGSGGGGSSTGPLTVSVSGPTQDRIGTAAQYTATVTGSSNTTVLWQVNGVAGGAAATGTISAAGLYLPPATLPSPNSVQITAVAAANTQYSGTATVALLNPVPVISGGTIQQVANTTNTFNVDVRGSGFLPTSTLNLNGSAVTATFVSSTELTAQIPVGLAVYSVPAIVSNIDPGASHSGTYPLTITAKSTTAQAAARLLDQATFGPTAADIAHVQAIGIDAWITEQMAATPSTMPALDPNNLPTYCNTNSLWTCVMTPWWKTVMTANDQLRQRAAFAYSQMFVASMLSAGQPVYAMPFYQNVLINDSLGNFSTLMHDVTLSPEMGLYLNMLNSAKPVTGSIANENFSRENMQLFTIGLYLLNQDGSAQTDPSGNPLPAYTQDQVQAFARAYTGWTWSSSTGGAPTKFPMPASYNYPMGAYEAQHDTGSKILLNGTTLPAGQTSLQDVNGALNNLFVHQNTAPFISRELIQHFVTSSPSPAYVSRVAAVFADNGTGVRGDLKAVMRAILEDQEARAGDTGTYDGGHLREPALALTGALRGLGATNTNSAGAWYQLSTAIQPLNEDPFRSPSVFNFFPPSYELPGAGTNAPEFAIENTATVILRLTLMNNIVFNKISGISCDLTATGTLGAMAANPAALVDYLGMLFLHSQMPSGMRTQIINTITAQTNNATRARLAVYLVLTSSEYKVIH